MLKEANDSAVAFTFFRANLYLQGLQAFQTPARDTVIVQSLVWRYLRPMDSLSFPCPNRFVDHSERTQFV